MKKIHIIFITGLLLSGSLSFQSSGYGLIVDVVPGNGYGVIDLAVTVPLGAPIVADIYLWNDGAPTPLAAITGYGIATEFNDAGAVLTLAAPVVADATVGYGVGPSSTDGITAPFASDGVATGGAVGPGAPLAPAGNLPGLPGFTGTTGGESIEAGFAPGGPGFPVAWGIPPAGPPLPGTLVLLQNVTFIATGLGTSTIGVNGTLVALPVGPGGPIAPFIAAAGTPSTGFAFYDGTTGAVDVDTSGGAFFGTVTVIPEPSSLSLMMLVLGGILARRKGLFRIY